MPTLARLRFVAIGHQQARMNDLVLEFRDHHGRATDSTLWLRNGGGKSSILNLFFAIVRPHRGEFLGGKAEAKQRSLNDYILTGDRALAIAEWHLDPPADTFAFDDDGGRFLTGVFYERREGSGELRRLYFSCRVSDEHPESTLEGLPIYLSARGTRTRRTLTGFREAWRLLRDRAPHLEVGDTEHQRDWQDVLDAARIDPELFSYQVRMNQREGGADELFRFAEAEDFVDFLLALALDPALGDRVGRNIGAFRRELLLRQEQLVPERDLVAGLIDRLSLLVDIHARRTALRQRLGEARDDLGSLDVLATDRLEALGRDAERAEAERAACLAAADDQGRTSERKRSRAARLRRHAASTRVKRLEEDERQLQDEWKTSQRLAKIWNAAIPLRRARQFEHEASEYRRLLEERQREHAPLRADLGESARQLASALEWRARVRRTEVAAALEREQRAREEARSYREQKAEAAKTQSRAETTAAGITHRLDEAERRRQQFVRDGLIATDEATDIALQRWTDAVRDRGHAIEHTRGEIARIDVTIDALGEAIDKAADVLQGYQTQHATLTHQSEQGTKAREAIERDAVLRTALELEQIDADRLGPDTLRTLDHAARAAQRLVLEEKLTVADTQRDAAHIEEHGLLPPSPDAQRIAEFLGSKLGGQAWSGWSWLQANVPKAAVRDAVRKAPWLAHGVVVRPADLSHAIALLRDARIEPEGPLLLADSDALPRAPYLPAETLGPRETAWFDREAAQTRLGELQVRLDDHAQRIQLAETQHRELVRARETLHTFRERYPIGWFDRLERELGDVAQRRDTARAHLIQLQEDRKHRTAERKALEDQVQWQTDALHTARQAHQRLAAFIDDHVLPAARWREDFAAARSEATRAAQDLVQCEEIAAAADERAGGAAAEARGYGEEASVLEDERSRVQYLDAEVIPAQGIVADLRARYRLLCSQYEEKVGADASAALAQHCDQEAQGERVRFNRLLSDDVTAAIVGVHLDALADPDRIEGLRDETQNAERSLFGKVGNLSQQIEAARKTLQEAEEACRRLEVLEGAEPIDRMPSIPEIALADADRLDQDARIADHERDVQSARAAEALQRAQDIRGRGTMLRHHLDRLGTLRGDYADLLASAAPPSGPRVPATIEESVLADLLKGLTDRLRQGRVEWQALDNERRDAASRLRAFSSDTPFDRLSASWIRSLHQHEESALEEESGSLTSQLDLRRKVLEDQIADIDRHRAILVGELDAVAGEGLRLLRQASTLSRLPDHVPGLGGAQFLRITTHEPDDPAERRARLAELIDELINGQHDLGGVALVQAAVRRLARPVQVRVLHPDPALDGRTVSIPEMARSSGGEQLTGAILLYCTLARVRGRARGLSKRASSVLVLDNPIGRASRVRFLELQREVARAMGVQLIYTTGVNDHEALRALPNIIRLRNERIDRNSGRRLVETVHDNSSLSPTDRPSEHPEEFRLVEAVRLARREDTSNGREPSAAEASDAAESEAGAR